MLRYLLPAALLAAAVAAGGARCLDFIDLSSLLMTVGGTLSVLLISYPTERLTDLARLLRASFTRQKQTREDLAQELKRLARLYRVNGSRALEAQENGIGDPFLKRAVALLVDLEAEQEISEQMESAAEEISARYRSGEQILATLAKLFPAFGLIGTLIGLVSLMREMATQPPEALTASFGLAIMTTLYGAVLANAVVLPLAAKLQAAGEERAAALRLIVEWVLALARGAAPSKVERTLNSLLSSNASELPRPAEPARGWRIFSWGR
ncbi:MAG TPA: MotA/TolQ/ExbB proton channel family protein [Verrucomicrobiae bacterium]|nr:MotA/TolQ/ExbB proton channel family protein [Verrucomicrobiae bacterium]